MTSSSNNENESKKRPRPAPDLETELMGAGRNKRGLIEEDDSSDAAIDSSDEENDAIREHLIIDGKEEARVGIHHRQHYKKRQKRGGTHTTTTTNTSMQSKEEHLYGVFFDDMETDDDNQKKKPSHGNGNHSTNYQRGHLPPKAPVFVSSKMTSDIKNSSPSVDRNGAANNNKNSQPPNDPSEHAWLTNNMEFTQTTTTTTRTKPLSFVKSSTASSSAASETPVKKNTMSFVPSTTATSTTTTTTTTTETPVQHDTNTNNNNTERDEENETKRLQDEQKKADDHFQALLQKAARRNKRSRPSSTTTAISSIPMTTTTAPLPPPPLPSMIPPIPFSHHPPPPGLGVGGAMPDSLPPQFGSSNSSNTMHFQRPQVPTAMNKKNPTIGKWEKHNKGFGSKMLAKMGWKGEGGLGSNRRQMRNNQSETGDDEAFLKPPASSTTTTPEPVTQATSSTTTITTPTPVVAGEDKARKGISRPVEVVVRPANMGLGFGNFKEQSQLKANRQIEAEVRGVEFEENDDDDRTINSSRKNKKRNNKKKGSTSKNTSLSSAIPSTDSILQKQSWKRLRSKSKTTASGPKIIPYEQLLQQQQDGTQQTPLIIDMTGPATTKDADSKQVQLGEELLHNISFLLNTYENKLHSCNSFVLASDRKVERLKAQLGESHQRIEAGESRVEKLDRSLAMVKDIQHLIDTTSMSPRKEVLSMIQTFGDSLTANDKVELQFYEVMLPAFLGPVVERQLEQWDPLGEISDSVALVDSLFGLSLDLRRDSDDEKGANAILLLRQELVQNLLIPRILSVLESTEWNPMQDMGVVVALYNHLHESALTLIQMSQPKADEASSIENTTVFGHGLGDDQESAASSFLRGIRRSLLFETIFPKLQGALSRWKPTMKQPGENGLLPELGNQLELFILPWIHFFDGSSIQANITSECKRKIKASLVYLRRKIDDDLDFVSACVKVLHPWSSVYELTVFQRLVSEHVTPSLARGLSKQKVYGSGTKQEWRGLLLAFELHDAAFLHNVEFLSVLESELLPSWAEKVHADLMQQDVSIRSVVENYREWKIRCLVKPDPDGPIRRTTTAKSLQLLRGDRHICACFSSVLHLIRLFSDGKKDQLQALAFQKTNYKVSIARREAENLASRPRKENETKTREEQYRSRETNEPTFRDVVEDFAEDRGIAFQPRMGSNSRLDGKQLFLFGSSLIYLEGDIVFHFIDTKWHPISLDRLAVTNRTSQ